MYQFGMKLANLVKKSDQPNRQKDNSIRPSITSIDAKPDRSSSELLKDVDHPVVPDQANPDLADPHINPDLVNLNPANPNPTNPNPASFFPLNPKPFNPVNLDYARLNPTNPKAADPNPDSSKTYSDRARKVWNFIVKTGILDPTNFKVNNLFVQKLTA